MNGWKTVKLGELFDFKNGLNKGVEYFGHGTPIVNYMDVNKRSYLTKDSVKGLVEVTKSELSNCGARKGDVFFTRTSETLDEIGLSSVLVDEIDNCVFSGYVLRARPKTKELLPKYCAYSLRVPTIRKEIMRKSSMTTRALTNGRFLSDVEFAYPKLDDQMRIVAVLETWDAYLEKLDKKIELKKYVKKGLMQNLLSGKKRLPGFNENWQEIHLHKLAKIHSGFGFPERLQGRTDYEIPFIKVSDMNLSGNEEVISRWNNTITGEQMRSIKAAVFPEGSIVFPKIGAAINTNKKRLLTKPTIVDNNIMALLPIDGRSSYFIFQWMNLFDLKRWANDAGVPSIRKSEVEGHLLMAPVDMNEMEAIGNLLRIADSEIATLVNIRKAAIAQKKHLENNLVNGNIRTNGLSIALAKEPQHA